MNPIRFLGGAIVIIALYLGVTSPSVYSISFPAVGLVGMFLAKTGGDK